MKDKTVPLTVPATPKKVPTPTSTPASAVQTSVTQEESESEEEDDNVKPRGKQSWKVLERERGGVHVRKLANKPVYRRRKIHFGSV